MMLLLLHSIVFVRILGGKDDQESSTVLDSNDLLMIIQMKMILPVTIDLDPDEDDQT